MNVSPAASAAPTTTTADGARRQEEAQARAATTSDFQTFLTLLTAQLRNQDPLKPMESTEFVAQLATFSSVEQQVRTNDQLERIFAQLAGGSQAGLAQWIGREVRAPVAANFQGVPVEIEFDPDPQAESRAVLVRNDFDQVVARLPVEAGRTTLLWDGTDGAGRSQPHGSYRFDVEASRGGEAVESAPGRVFGLVREVRLEGGSPVLVLEGGATTSAGAVTAVR